MRFATWLTLLLAVFVSCGAASTMALVPGLDTTVIATTTPEDVYTLKLHDKLAHVVVEVTGASQEIITNISTKADFSDAISVVGTALFQNEGTFYGDAETLYIKIASEDIDESVTLRAWEAMPLFDSLVNKHTINGTEAYFDFVVCDTNHDLEVITEEADAEICVMFDHVPAVDQPAADCLGGQWFTRSTVFNKDLFVTHRTGLAFLAVRKLTKDSNVAVTMVNEEAILLKPETVSQLQTFKVASYPRCSTYFKTTSRLLPGEEPSAVFTAASLEDNKRVHVAVGANFPVVPASKDADHDALVDSETMIQVPAVEIDFSDEDPAGLAVFVHSASGYRHESVEEISFTLGFTREYTPFPPTNSADGMHVRWEHPDLSLPMKDRKMVVDLEEGIIPRRMDAPGAKPCMGFAAMWKGAQSTTRRGAKLAVTSAIDTDHGLPPSKASASVFGHAIGGSRLYGQQVVMDPNDATTGLYYPGRMPAFMSLIADHPFETETQDVTFYSAPIVEVPFDKSVVVDAQSGKAVFIRVPLGTSTDTLTVTASSSMGKIDANIYASQEYIFPATAMTSQWHADSVAGEEVETLTIEGSELSQEPLYIGVSFIGNTHDTVTIRVAPQFDRVVDSEQTNVQFTHEKQKQSFEMVPDRTMTSYVPDVVGVIVYIDEHDRELLDKCSNPAVAHAAHVAVTMKSSTASDHFRASYNTAYSTGIIDAPHSAEATLDFSLELVDWTWGVKGCETGMQVTATAFSSYHLENGEKHTLSLPPTVHYRYIAVERKVSSNYWLNLNYSTPEDRGPATIEVLKADGVEVLGHLSFGNTLDVALPAFEADLYNHEIIQVQGGAGRTKSLSIDFYLESANAMPAGATVRPLITRDAPFKGAVVPSMVPAGKKFRIMAVMENGRLPAGTTKDEDMVLCVSTKDDDSCDILSDSLPAVNYAHILKSSDTLWTPEALPHFFVTVKMGHAVHERTVHVAVLVVQEAGKFDVTKPFSTPVTLVPGEFSFFEIELTSNVHEDAVERRRPPFSMVLDAPDFKNGEIDFDTFVHSDFDFIHTASNRLLPSVAMDSNRFVTMQGLASYSVHPVEIPSLVPGDKFLIGVRRRRSGELATTYTTTMRSAPGIVPLDEHHDVSETYEATMPMNLTKDVPLMFSKYVGFRSADGDMHMMVCEGDVNYKFDYLSTDLHARDDSQGSWPKSQHADHVEGLHWSTFIANMGELPDKRKASIFDLAFYAKVETADEHATVQFISDRVYSRRPHVSQYAHDVVPVRERSGGIVVTVPEASPGSQSGTIVYELFGVPHNSKINADVPCGAAMGTLLGSTVDASNGKVHITVAPKDVAKLASKAHSVDLAVIAVQLDAAGNTLRASYPVRSAYKINAAAFPMSTLGVVMATFGAVILLCGAVVGIIMASRWSAKAKARSGYQALDIEDDEESLGDNAV